jgi:hypothetical protein
MRLDTLTFSAVVLLAGCMRDAPRETVWQTTDGQTAATGTGHSATADEALYARFSEAFVACSLQFNDTPRPPAPTVLQGLLNPGYVANQNPQARLRAHTQACMGAQGFVERQV